MNWFSICFERAALLAGALCVSATVLSGCAQDEQFSDEYYACEFSHEDTSEQHPKAEIYQSILDENQNNGIVGAVLLVKDRQGTFIGATGHADLASNVEMRPCNRFAIASISKVFTAAAVYRLVDAGVWDIEDVASKWLSDRPSKRVRNADEATIAHLLSHTSGIRDYYTDQFELDRENRFFNHFQKEDVLKYVYGKKALFDVGETYAYSNTNYLLLSMMMEQATKRSFPTIYREEIFEPLSLDSAYYSESQVIPDGMVKGYADTGDGRLVESRSLYGDELGIGGDGGVIINAYDLAQFLEKLMNGELISQESLAKMTDWFALPDGWQWDTYGQYENGYGLERFDTDYGTAVGHTGSIDGFNSFAFYFPEDDMSYVLLVNNTYAFDTAKQNIFHSVLEEMYSDTP